METKKTKRADLENKKGIFLQIGFIIVLALGLGAFEWESASPDVIDWNEIAGSGPDIEIIPITRPKEIEKIEIKKKAMPELKVVPDDIKTAEEPIQVDVEGGDFAIPFEPNVDPNVDEIFYIVSDPPVFGNGGEAAFIKFIHSKVKYPVQAIEAGIKGTVYVSFVVNENGDVVDAHIVKGVHPSLDNEALRVINLSPRWTPGKQMTRKVKVAFTMPVRFQLTN